MTADEWVRWAWDNYRAILPRPVARVLAEAEAKRERATQ